MSTNQITEKLHNTKVLEFINPKDKVITVKNTECIETAVRILSKNNIHSCPVVNEKNGCMGVIDMFDVVNHMTSVAPTDSDKNSLEVAGRAIALKDINSSINKTSNDIYIPIEQDNPTTLLLKMFSMGTHRCPITNKEGYVVGTVSQSDIMRWLYEQSNTYFKKMELFGKSLKEVGLGKQSLIQISDDMIVKDVLSLVDKEGVTAVPVVNKNGIIVGNFSIVDLKGMYFEEWPSFFLPIVDYLRKHSPKSLIKNWEASCLEIGDLKVIDVLKFFNEHKFHRVWLVKEGKPVSVVSHTDIINLITTYEGQ